MSAVAIGARVRDVVSSMVPGGPREVRSPDRLADDLGFDSLALLELALALEVEFDLQAIPEDHAVSLVTVRDLETVIADLVTDNVVEPAGATGHGG
jgi:acyl carrier protein